MDYERCSRCSYLECDLDDYEDRLADAEGWCYELEYTIEQQSLDRALLRTSLQESQAEAQTNLTKLAKLKSELNPHQRTISGRQLDRRQDRDKIDRLMNENITLQEEQAASTETQDKLRTRLKQARELVEAVTKTKNDSLAALTKALQEARTLLENGKADTQHMEAELRAKDDSLAALAKRLEEACTLLDRNKADKQHMEAELKAKDDSLAALAKRLEEACTLLDRNKADKQHMEAELKAKDDSMAALTKRLEESCTLLERNKADKQHLQAELKAKEEFLGQHLSKLGKAEADVSALTRDVETLESTEAELRRSIAGCWLHSFRAWRRKFTGSLTN